MDDDDPRLKACPRCHRLVQQRTINIHAKLLRCPRWTPTTQAESKDLMVYPPISAVLCVVITTDVGSMALQDAESKDNVPIVEDAPIAMVVVDDNDLPVPPPLLDVIAPPDIPHHAAVPPDDALPIPPAAEPLTMAMIIRWLVLSLVNMRGAQGLSIHTINIIITMINHVFSMIITVLTQHGHAANDIKSLKLPKDYYQSLAHLGINREAFIKRVLCSRCAKCHDNVLDANGVPVKLRCDGHVYHKHKDELQLCDAPLWVLKKRWKNIDETPTPPSAPAPVVVVEEKHVLDRRQRYKKHRGGESKRSASPEVKAAAAIIEPVPIVPAAPPSRVSSKKLPVQHEPKMVYAKVNLRDVIRERFTSPQFVTNIKHWLTRPPPNLPAKGNNRGASLMDVYDATTWKHFNTISIDGNRVPLLHRDTPMNLAFSVCIDWFQAYSHTSHSVGAIQIAILNLPRHLRFVKENIIIYSTIPGPREPSTMMHIMNELVDELLDLYRNGITVSIDGVDHNVRCIMLSLNCDLPASRKVSGHAGHSGRHGCGRCTQQFPHSTEYRQQFPDLPDCKKTLTPCEVDLTTGHVLHPLRTTEDHRAQCHTYQHEHSKKKRAELRTLHGTHETAFVRLPYFNTISMVLVDPLHNLWLGIAKAFWYRMVRHGHVSKEQLILMQQFIDDTKLPVHDIPRMPHKLTVTAALSGFGNLIGAEWQAWTLHYSTPAMAHAGVAHKYRKIWRSFVNAATLINKPVVDEQDVYDARKRFAQFHDEVQKQLGLDWCTPNYHQSLHICDMVLAYGPVSAFWGYGFERMNGVLGNVANNNHDVETQLLRFSIEAAGVRRAITLLPSSLPGIVTLSRDRGMEVDMDERMRRYDYNNADTLVGLVRQPGNGPIINKQNKSDQNYELSVQQQEELADYLFDIYKRRAVYFTPYVTHYHGYQLGGRQLRTKQRNDTASWVYVAHGNQEWVARITAFFKVTVYVSPDRHHPLDEHNDFKPRDGTTIEEHIYAYCQWYEPIGTPPIRIYFQFHPIEYIVPGDVYALRFVPLHHILGMLAVHKSKNGHWSGMRIPLKTAY